jgi:two-component system, OmpR family, sensor kinase
MKLSVRLWLLGAVVPFAGTTAALVVAGQVFRADLEHGVDEGLLSQAAVEAVSLFDGPGNKPHLHLATSPLGERVRHIAPAAAIYGPTGQLLARHPPDVAPRWTDASLRLDGLGPEPRLETRTLPGGARLRVLTALVRDPTTGIPHGLQLAASFAPVDATIRSYYRIAVGMALGLGAALFLLQSYLAHRLRRRVETLTGHMRALREGNLDAVAPPADGGDEIAELARVVAAATGKLRAARAAQDRLVADAAHELRTPLTLMRTSIDVALRRRRDAPELVASLEETRREVERLAALSARLLDLATAGRGAWDRAPGDLARVACDAAEAARGAAEERAVLVTVDAAGPVPATFDAHGVRQAIDNLVANAIRFSPRGGEVRVRVDRAGEVARIAVEDGGPGIAPADRERVFEPFEREKATGGAGLGLAIVREIARGHGGRVFVDDVANGARVVLELPVGPADAPGRATG